MDNEITTELIEKAVSNPENESVVELSDKTVVYFDQKAWGATWEAANSSDEDNESLNKLAKRSADELDFVYPFSIENLVETSSASDVGFKSELFDTMALLSGNHTVRNYLDVFNHEARNYICDWHNLLPKLNTRSFVFGKGLVHVAGDWTIRSEGDVEIPEGLKEEFAKIVKDDEINRRLLQSRVLTDEAPGVTDNEKREYKENYQARLQERERDLDIDDDEDRSLYLTETFRRRMMPALRQYAFDLNVHPAEIVVTDPYQWSFEMYFQQFPAFYTYATLCFAADARRNNNPEFNDVLDISQLAVAAPYADIVVTEQFFGGMLYKFDIGEVFDTNIFTDVNKFASFLREQLD